MRRPIIFDKAGGIIRLHFDELPNQLLKKNYSLINDNKYLKDKTLFHML